MDSPFAMSFDDIKAQAEANMRADKGEAGVVKQTASTEKSFLEMVTKAEKDLAGIKEEEETKEQAPEVKADNGLTSGQPSVPPSMSGMSFEDMFNQAQSGQLGNSASIETVFEQNQTANENDQAAASSKPEEKVQENEQENSFPMNAPEQEEKPDTQKKEQAAGPMSFEDMMRQAQNELQAMEEPSKEEAAKEEAAKEEVPEETAKEEVPEEPSKEEVPEEAAKEEVPEEPSKEEVPEEAAKEEVHEEPVKGKKSGSRKSKKKEDPEPKEVIPDNTEDYKVDILGENQSVPGSESNETDDRRSLYPKSLNNLFTQDEIATLRADIRTFVRKELKMAVVGAIKDLLADFDE